jgi:hypothetical protein
MIIPIEIKERSDAKFSVQTKNGQLLIRIAVHNEVSDHDFLFFATKEQGASLIVAVQAALEDL